MTLRLALRFLYWFRPFYKYFQKFIRNICCDLLKHPTFCIAMVALFVPTITHAENLTQKDCRLIDLFNAESEIPYTDFLSRRIHLRSFCVDGQRFCEVPLSKRDDDFHIFFNEDKPFLEQPSDLETNMFVSNILSKVQASTGLSKKPFSNRKVSGFVWVVFVQSDLLEEDKSNYLNTFISPRLYKRSPKDLQKQRDLFNSFVRSDLNCLTNVDRFTDNLIRGTYIWIKSGLEDQAIAQCLADEFVGAMGIQPIADTRLSGFSGMGLPAWGKVNDTKLDHISLKFLYSPRMRRGVSMRETENISQQIYSDSCE